MCAPPNKYIQIRAVYQLQLKVITVVCRRRRKKKSHKKGKKKKKNRISHEENEHDMLQLERDAGPIK